MRCKRAVACVIPCCLTESRHEVARDEVCNMMNVKQRRHSEREREEARRHHAETDEITQVHSITKRTRDEQTDGVGGKKDGIASAEISGTPFAIAERRITGGIRI